MSPTLRPLGRREPDPVEVAGARLRALRLVPDPPAARSAGAAWSRERDWGGWVPGPDGSWHVEAEPVMAADSVDEPRYDAERSVDSTEPVSAAPAAPAAPTPWDRLLARSPLALAGALERLGWRWAAGLVVTMAIVAAAVGGGLVGRHLAGSRPRAVAQAFPDLGGSPGSPSTATGVGGAGVSAAGNSLATGGAAGSIVVDVEGRVRHPGLATLPSGARIADAIRAAGGLRRPVHDPSLDLAARVGDGQLLAIGRGGSGSATGGTATGTEGGIAAGSDPSSAAGGATSAPLNLNTASEAQLEALPGVGPVLAGRILAYREQQGGFSAVSDLQNVPGIGPSHYAEISPVVTT